MGKLERWIQKAVHALQEESLDLEGFINLVKQGAHFMAAYRVHHPSLTMH